MPLSHVASNDCAEEAWTARPCRAGSVEKGSTEAADELRISTCGVFIDLHLLPPGLVLQVSPSLES